MPKKAPRVSSKYDELYEDWLDYLLTGFNILVRGRGSKVKLVEEFCEQNFSSETVVQVYGHSPGETIKSVLQKVVAAFGLRIKLPLSVNVGNATEIVDTLEERETMGYLVIHNLDASGFRDPMVLEILSVLVRSKQLRLIATLCCEWGDVYWNQDLKRIMRLVEYTERTNKYEPDEFFDLNPAASKKKKGQVHTMESLDMIWTALPSNAQRIFIRLYELIQCSDESFIHFHELLAELKKDLWTLNEHLLGQQLTEFISHSVINKAADGTITFTVEPVLLATFIESKQPS